MGCAASDLGSTIESTVKIHNEPIQDEKIDSKNVNKVCETPIHQGDVNSSESAEILEAAEQKSESRASTPLKEFEVQKSPIQVKIDLNNLTTSPTANTVDGEYKSATVNKGFVAFEINLNGQVETSIDTLFKRQLPKRLKHLEPLERAPRLTAEELNDKLEKAELKRQKALAKWKCVPKKRPVSANWSPNQTGDTANEQEKLEASPIDFENEDSPSERMIGTGISISPSANSEEYPAPDSQLTMDDGNEEEVKEAISINGSNNNASARHRCESVFCLSDEKDKSIGSNNDSKRALIIQFRHNSQYFKNRLQVLKESEEE